MKLILHEVNAQERSHLATLENDEVIIGREPEVEGGLAFDREGVSREHLMLFRAGSHWCVQDLGSTNGSWLNGDKLVADQFNLLRSGDVLQLAAVALQVSYDNPESLENSALVFKGSHFLKQFPVPEQGRALVIGGNQADLELDGSDGKLAGLIVERRGGRIYAYKQNEAYEVTHNNKKISHMSELQDRDCLKVDSYSVIIFNATSLSSEGLGTSGVQRRPHFNQQGDSLGVEQGVVEKNPMFPKSEEIKELQDNSPARRPQVPLSEKSYTNPSFGKDRRNDEESRESYDPYKSGVFKNPMHTHSGRYEVHPFESKSALSGAGEQIVLIAIFVMVFIVFGLLILWVLS